MPAATIVLLLILQFGGRPAVQASEGAAETEPTSKPADANAAAHPSKGGTPPAPSETRKPVAAAAAKAASGRPS